MRSILRAKECLCYSEEGFKTSIYEEGEVKWALLIRSHQKACEVFYSNAFKVIS